MVSIIIPVYEMGGRGVEMLAALFKSLKGQTYTDYEIVVSDNSENDELFNLCKCVVYTRNPGPHDNPASNFNNAIKHAKGDIIKPMCQDDYFIDVDALAKFSKTVKWSVCESSDHIPYWNFNMKKLREGENTYGSPSAVAWKKNDLLFDENLLWLMDCELWARMIEKHGQPDLLLDTKIGIRKWEGQLTHQLSHRRVTDLEYVQNKYK